MRRWRPRKAFPSGAYVVDITSRRSPVMREHTKHLTTLDQARDRHLRRLAASGGTASLCPASVLTGMRRGERSCRRFPALCPRGRVRGHRGPLNGPARTRSPDGRLERTAMARLAGGRLVCSANACTKPPLALARSFRRLRASPMTEGTGEADRSLGHPAIPAGGRDRRRPQRGGPPCATIAGRSRSCAIWRPAGTSLATAASGACTTRGGCRCARTSPPTAARLVDDSRMTAYVDEVSPLVVDIESESRCSVPGRWHATSRA